MTMLSKYTSLRLGLRSAFVLVQTIWLIGCASSGGSLTERQTIPDFDRPIGSTGLLFQSYGNDQIALLVPGHISLQRRDNGLPDFHVKYSANRKEMWVSVGVRIDTDEATARTINSDAKKFSHGASVQVAEPIAYVLAAGQDFESAEPEGDNRFRVTFRAGKVFRRILESMPGFGGDFFVINYMATYEGVEGSDRGSRARRMFATGGSFNIQCSLVEQSVCSEVKHRKSMTRSAVSAWQRKLRRLHLYAGPIDGRYGKLSREGTRRVQRRFGWPTDGELTYKLIAKSRSLR